MGCGASSSRERAIFELAHQKSKAPREFDLPDPWKTAAHKRQQAEKKKQAAQQPQNIQQARCAAAPETPKAALGRGPPPDHRREKSVWEVETRCLRQNWRPPNPYTSSK